LKAWALQILGGNTNFSVEWFGSCVYRGYRIPKRYRRLFMSLVDTMLQCESPGRLRSLRRQLRLYLSALNIYQVVIGPYSPDCLKQIRGAFALPANISPEQDLRYKSCLRLATYAILKNLPSKADKLRPTGQTVAIAPGRNGSWKQFVSSQIFTVLADWTSDDYGKLLTPSRLLLKPSVSYQGNLTFIGEEGGKTRMILVGDPFIQTQLRPLQRALLDILKEVPTDCTFCQGDGVRFIEQAYREHKKLYSVDLSDATWNFPSSLQDYVLSLLGVKRKVRKLIFSTPVYDPINQKIQLVEKGQAMGLGPSFPLFSLTHNLVLLALCKIIGISPIDSYRVLGDDVFMTDSRLYLSYLDFLRAYEVPISKNKTLVSSVLGEFAGKVIFRGVDITPIRWKKLSWNSLPTLYLDYISVLGRKKITLLFGKGARISLSILGPLSKKVGGLNLTIPKDTASPRVKSLRCGVLESILRGEISDKSSGVHKIHNSTVEIQSLFKSLFTPDVLRTLDTLLVDDSIYQTEYGILPSLSPNPARTLTQLGYKLNLIPERIIFSLDEGFKLRFRRSKRTDWKAYQIEVLNFNLEEIREKEKQTNAKAATEAEPSVLRDFFC
jgi:hypothetical protein